MGGKRLPRGSVRPRRIAAAGPNEVPTAHPKLRSHSAGACGPRDGAVSVRLVERHGHVRHPGRRMRRQLRGTLGRDLVNGGCAVGRARTHGCRRGEPEGRREQ